MCETLREPVKVLKSLSEQAINKQYKFKRLYRNLYNLEFYFLAYKNISQSQGSMTSGVDGKSLDGMSEKRISALIESIRSFSYQPNPARRVYIEKKNSTKKRPLGIPSTEDKLVQEVVKMILESIYEPNFSDCSHGFRPKRSCHSALQQIQNQFTGITWFVEGDIHACFDSFDHHDKNGKEIWDSHHRGNMVHMTDVEIVSQVNAEIRGMYNYYSIAENATVIKNFAFILEYSMYKTFGLKYRKSVYKIQRKYRKNGIFMVPYNTKKGLRYCEFYHDGFKKKRYACGFEPDLLPQYVKYDNPNYLRTRIKLGVCELCGENTGDICMHHVRSLKSIQADNEWNTIMLAKRRKTLAVCPNCYAKITK